jgi:hypothetical protein
MSVDKTIMTNRPEMAIIIPWCDRPELSVALKANAPILLRSSVELVIVNCAGKGKLLSKLIPEIISPKAKIANVPSNRFNKSLALNLGCYLTTAEVLFFLDADIILKTFRVREGEARNITNKCFFTIRSVKESEGFAPGKNGLQQIAYTISLVKKGGTRAKIDASRTDLVKGTRSAPGLIMLRRSDFLRVGGMNSELKGWGWEDLDLAIRLQLHLKRKHKQGWMAIHLTHSNASRNILSNKHADENQNASICLAHYQMGDFRGTYLKDVSYWKKRVVIRAGSLNNESSS